MPSVTSESQSVSTSSPYLSTIVGSSASAGTLSRDLAPICYADWGSPISIPRLHGNLTVDPASIGNVKSLGPNIAFDHRPGLNLHPLSSVDPASDLAAGNDLGCEDVPPNHRAWSHKQLGSGPDGSVHHALDLDDSFTGEIAYDCGADGDDRKPGGFAATRG
jgi:hypothetical protein